MKGNNIVRLYIFQVYADSFILYHTAAAKSTKVLLSSLQVGTQHYYYEQYFNASKRQILQNMTETDNGK